MESIKIHGGVKLSGTVRIQGSKNTTLPILAATILIRGKTELSHCPDILDIGSMLDIMRENGCRITWKKEKLIIDASQCNGCLVSQKYAQRIRSSITFLGAMLARNKRAVIPYPGGCSIGKRPIDLHLSALSKMNASFHEKEKILYADTKQLQGAFIRLKKPSVGATENIIIAAVLAKGTTRVKGAACEPEIVYLCDFLNKAGANIVGVGTSYLVIRGVEKLKEIKYHIPSDRIVAGTYALACVATRGHIFIENCPKNELEALIKELQRTGVRIRCYGRCMELDARSAYGPIPYITTTPYPGFPTDLQPQTVVVMTTFHGRSRIHESVFENRFRFVNQLRLMGAQIETNGEDACIDGGVPLKGRTVYAEDLRGGAALVIAGLSAYGITIVENAEVIERGYEDICRDLNNLGARMRKI